MDRGISSGRFIEDANILVWEETTRKAEAVHTQGDAINLTMSLDGRVVK
jgi:hypothetical protein